jgi:hypothetical protein
MKEEQLYGSESATGYGAAARVDIIAKRRRTKKKKKKSTSR